MSNGFCRPLLHLCERTRGRAHNTPCRHTEILSLLPLLHPPEQLLMFHSSRLDLVTDRGVTLPHARNCCSVPIAWRRARWLLWLKAVSMLDNCDGDIHSRVLPKHALANNNSNNSCYAGTLSLGLKCPFRGLFL